MKKIILAIVLLYSTWSTAQTLPGKKANGTLLLPNGWSISPAGESLPLGDFPMNLAVSKSGKWMAALNNGQGKHSLQLINTRRKKVVHHLNIPLGYLGVAFSDNEKMLYVSGGNKNEVYRYRIDHQKLILIDTFVVGKPWPERISLCGLTVDDRRNRLYVVTKENNSLYVLDLTTRKVVQQVVLDAAAYTCALTPDKKRLLITIWGGNKLSVWNPDSGKIERNIAVGDNPNDIAVSKNSRWAYIANADDNSVSVVDLQQGKTVETLVASLFPDAPTGSTTNSVGLSKDEKTLLVANADNNCLAVFDVSKPGKSTSKGFVPVGWYPTCVRVLGKHIFVANGKGVTSFANSNGPNPLSLEQNVAYQKGDTSVMNNIAYIGNLMKGTMSVIAWPDDKTLAAYTRQVYANSPYTKAREKLAEGEKGNPIPQRVGDPSPIKYVFYIIKENRTYDQVLGDLKGGNGDPSLCLFPEKITPNQHALAKEFVLLDNFYVAAEVSADGHNWSTAAYANDYTEKTWIQSYGEGGGDYVYEGQSPIAYPKDGFMWDHCQRKGISYRTYGEFADDYKPNYKTIVDHFCPYFTSWDTRVKDTTRVTQWKRDFDSLLNINQLPHLNTLRLINDHTEGLRKGAISPTAQVADNDLAVGQFVEYLSQSRIWAQSAVFILEDDAQNGADHIDAHRSIAFVVSPFTRRHFRDTTLYTTNSMLRTIGLLLGFGPMSQHDAAATSMWRCFTQTPDLSPFKSIVPQIDLDERNTRVDNLSRQFDYFDFAGEDRVPDLLFNQLLWKAIKGDTTEMPAPRRGAWIKTGESEDSED